MSTLPKIIQPPPEPQTGLPLVLTLLQHLEKHCAEILPITLPPTGYARNTLREAIEVLRAEIRKGEVRE